LREVHGVPRDWRKLHNEELCDIFSSANVCCVIRLRRIRWVGHVARTGDRRGAYMDLVGIPDANSLLGGPRLRWHYNIKMHLQEVVG
jgi:hypothetical protein